MSVPSPARAHPGSPTVAVVVCTATDERRELLHACVESLLGGRRAPDELLVVVDTNPTLAAELRASLPAAARVLESARPGLSEARNVGIETAGAHKIAFVDDDAAVEAGWLSALAEAFAQDEAVIGVGGPVLPRWGAERRWLQDELLWIVGCTYRGHREDAGPIRNPIGCNMAFDRSILRQAGGFATTFGKRGNALETCEETELALRLERAHGASRIHFVPQARVRHYVPGSRVSWRLLVRRSLSEGLAKGRLHRLYESPALGTERTYARLLLMERVPRLLFVALRERDLERAAGALAIVASLLITALAFVAGGVRATLRRSAPAADPESRCAA